MNITINRTATGLIFLIVANDMRSMKLEITSDGDIVKQENNMYPDKNVITSKYVPCDRIKRIIEGMSENNQEILHSRICGLLSTLDYKIAYFPEISVFMFDVKYASNVSINIK